MDLYQGKLVGVCVINMAYGRKVNKRQQLLNAVSDAARLINSYDVQRKVTRFMVKQGTLHFRVGGDSF